MIVRQAALSDAEAIAYVHVLSWQAGYAGLLPQHVLDGLDPAQRVPRWQAAVRAAAWPERGTLVAEQRGNVVGFANLLPARFPDLDPGRVGEVSSFYVLPELWGRGVGTALMATTMATFRRAGFTSAVLWVLETNTRALTFYSRLGWRPDGAARLDELGGAVIRDLRYQRPLDAEPAGPDS